MFVVCYEISKKQVEADNRLTSGCCLDNLSALGFSSCEDMDEEQREHALEAFPAIFPKGMFTRIGKDVFRYNGGYAKLETDFVVELKGLMEKLPTHNVLESLGELSFRMDHPLGNTRFYFGDIFPAVETDFYFMRFFLKNLQEGDIVYIGGCVNFQY